MNKKIKVSVCIPVYNCEKFIKEAIDSVLNQTFLDFELLIIDNKSTDGTLEKIKEYSDKRIRIIENETNIGFEKNWNKCLQEAQGELIKILPADDFLYPTCLEQQVNILENPVNKNIVLVSAGRHIVNEKSQILMKRLVSKEKLEIKGSVAVKKLVSQGNNYIGEPGVALFRKSLIEKVGFFDTSIFYVVDVDYWSRILLYGDLYIIPEILGAFRISSDSSSVQVFSKQKKQVKDFFERLYNNKKYNISFFTLFLGKMKVSIYYGLLRKLLYYWVLNKKSK